MFVCQTEQLKALISPRVISALDALLSFQDVFSHETTSYAIGELSEHLVRSLTNGERIKRANRGFDIISGLEKIEVKARFVGKYREGDVHFNFGKHSKTADTGYCLLWQSDQGERAHLTFAVKAPMSNFGALMKNHQKTYFARPTVRQLKAALLISQK